MILLNMDIIDNLKCCGNCKYSDKYTAQCGNADSDLYLCEIAHGYCKFWNQDSYTKDNRNK